MDDKATTLHDLALGEGGALDYQYDFGDGWDHVIRIEKVLDADPLARYPVCLDGQGACPPEECGGVWGYRELLAKLADSDHEDHDPVEGGSASPRARTSTLGAST